MAKKGSGPNLVGNYLVPVQQPYIEIVVPGVSPQISIGRLAKGNVRPALQGPVIGQAVGQPRCKVDLGGEEEPQVELGFKFFTEKTLLKMAYQKGDMLQGLGMKALYLLRQVLRRFRVTAGLVALVIEKVGVYEAKLPQNIPRQICQKLGIDGYIGILGADVPPRQVFSEVEGEILTQRFVAQPGGVRDAEGMFFVIHRLNVGGYLAVDLRNIKVGGMLGIPAVEKLPVGL